MPESRVADPGGVVPDPDPTSKKTPNPGLDPAFKKKPGPDPTHEKQPGSRSYPRKTTRIRILPNFDQKEFNFHFFLST
mgnify:CR=1 FL=1